MTIPSRSALFGQLGNIRSVAETENSPNKTLIFQLCEMALDSYDSGDIPNAFRLMVFAGALTKKSSWEILDSKIKEIVTQSARAAGVPPPAKTLKSIPVFTIDELLGQQFLVNPGLKQTCFAVADSTGAKVVTMAIFHADGKHGPEGESVEFFAAVNHAITPNPNVGEMLVKLGEKLKNTGFHKEGEAS